MLGKLRLVDEVPSEDREARLGCCGRPCYQYPVRAAPRINPATKGLFVQLIHRRGNTSPGSEAVGGKKSWLTYGQK